MAKPTGAICNLDCQYCYFLTKEALYPGSDFRMSADVLRAYIQQTFDARSSDQVTLAWQGGEPTIMGLDFYQEMMSLVAELSPEGVRVQHTLQTNGTLLDDAWCEFLRENDFLVGLSMDGPAQFHDSFRVDKGGKPTHARVMDAWNLLKKHSVEVNILCTVNSANSREPLAVYSFFRDELGARYIQFIPIVEETPDGVSERSVRPEEWGNFLRTVFDEWITKDVGKVFVQHFDVALENWHGLPASLCVFSETCGNALLLEHNGDLYSCDHYVDPEYLLGNILHKPIRELALLPKQKDFGLAKRDSLPSKCRQCDVLFACRGECPKLRITKTEEGEPGLHFLCEGYYSFFKHIDGPMKAMSQLLRNGRRASEIMP